MGGIKYDAGKVDLLDFISRCLNTPEGAEILKQLATEEEPILSPEQFDALDIRGEMPGENAGWFNVAFDPTTQGIFTKFGYLSDFIGALMVVVRQSIFGGEVKGYGRGNWTLGMDWSRPVNAALRHLFKWQFLKRARDQQSGSPELSGFAWNALAILTYSLKQVGTDDRDKYKAGE